MISISNSNVFFIIRNCYLNDGSTEAFYGGILFQNVRNGTISSNQIHPGWMASNPYCILLDWSDNNNVSDNYVLGCNDGIYLSDSNNNTLSNNNCSGNGDGIYLAYSLNNTVYNNSCPDNLDCGIELFLSGNNTLSNNNCSGNYDGGIALDLSNNNKIHNNTVRNNIYYTSMSQFGISIGWSCNNSLIGNKLSYGGMSVWGGQLECFNTHVIDMTNLVNGNPFYYFKNQSGITVPAGAGQVLLANCTDMRVENQNLNNATFGIEIAFCTGLIITNNTCSGNYDGILIPHNSSNTIISNNNYSDNYHDGIDIERYSDNNAIYNNTCSGNGCWGIFLGSSSRNILVNNSCSDNAYDGIELWHSDNNTLSDNNCSNNVNEGVSLVVESKDNRVWNNTFYHNNDAGDVYDPLHIQAYDEGINNWWNSSDGYGNWWSDWATPDDVAPLGIVDSPYDINGSAGAKDFFPRTTSHQMDDLRPDPMVMAGSIALFQIFSYVNTEMDLQDLNNNISYGGKLRVVATVTNEGLGSVKNVSVSLDINGTGTALGENAIGGLVKFVDLNGTGQSGSSKTVEWNYTLIPRWAGQYRINITVDKEYSILNDKNRSNNNAWRTINLTYIYPMIRLFEGAPPTNVTAGTTITVVGDVRYPVTYNPMAGVSVTVQLQNSTGVVVNEQISTSSTGGIFQVVISIPSGTPAGQYKIVVIVGQTQFESIIYVVNHDIFGPSFIIMIIGLIAVLSAITVAILLGRKRQSIEALTDNEENLTNQPQQDPPR